VDGDSDPKTASWRAHHGAMTRAKSATHASAADHGIAGLRAPPDRQATQFLNGRM
jgi:hypothetical protein